MHSFSTTTLIAVVLVLVALGGLVFAFAKNQEQQHMLAIQSFNDCKAAGYPILESYPEQCKTPDGRTFVNDQSGMHGNGCAVAGCSAQLCVSAKDAASVVTTCEYRSEYICYKEASCEPQADGKCGWTQTQQLQKCLASPPAMEDGTVEAVY